MSASFRRETGSHAETRSETHTGESQKNTRMKRVSVSHENLLHTRNPPSILLFLIFIFQIAAKNGPVLLGVRMQEQIPER